MHTPRRPTGPTVNRFSDIGLYRAILPYFGPFFGIRIMKNYTIHIHSGYGVLIKIKSNYIMSKVEKPKNQASFPTMGGRTINLIGKCIGTLVMVPVAGVGRGKPLKRGLAATIRSGSRDMDILMGQEQKLQNDMKVDDAFKKARKAQMDIESKAQDAEIISEEARQKAEEARNEMINYETEARTAEKAEDKLKAQREALRSKSRMEEYEEDHKKLQEEATSLKGEAAAIHIDDYLDDAHSEEEEPFEEPKAEKESDKDTSGAKSSKKESKKGKSPEETIDEAMEDEEKAKADA